MRHPDINKRGKVSTPEGQGQKMAILVSNENWSPGGAVV